MKIRKQFDADYVSSDYDTEVSSETIVQQHLKSQCDINKVLERWLKTGFLDHEKKVNAQYADVSNLDYRYALDTTIRAEESFMSLPSRLRRDFDNDPAQFLEWMQSDVDIEKKQEFGLLKKSLDDKKEVENSPEDDPAA